MYEYLLDMLNPGIDQKYMCYTRVFSIRYVYYNRILNTHVIYRYIIYRYCIMLLNIYLFRKHFCFDVGIILEVYRNVNFILRNQNRPNNAPNYL